MTTSEQAAAEMRVPLIVTYRNWRGEVSERRILPILIRYGTSKWHPEPQWLMLATDVDKGEEREFALKGFGASDVPANGPVPSQDGLAGGTASKKEAPSVTGPNPAGASATPSALWRASGEPDPFGKNYDCERAELSSGHLTDDQVANAVFLDPSIVFLTAAKERIRWLSRKLEAIRAAASEKPADGWCFDMDKAPRYQTPIIVFVSNWVGDARFIDGVGWYEANVDPTDYCGEAIYPTAWRPFPSPPATEPPR